MTQRRTKTSSGDLSVYAPYVREGMQKYGTKGWMTWKIRRKRYKGVDTIISIETKPSIL